MEMAGRRDEDSYSDEEVIEMLARQKGLNFKPGEEFLYSNTGYYLLGVIVKRVSGLSLRQFAKENIFKPLGMVHTHFHDDHTEVVQHRAMGYSPRQGSGFRIDMTTQDLVGDGGVFTSIEDLFLWDQNMYHNRLGRGDAELIRQVLTPGKLNNGEELNYAFGLEVGDYRGLKMVSHSGGYVGFRAEMIRFPEQRVSVICLANLGSIVPERLARQVADIYLSDRLELPEVRFLEETRISKEKAGIYRSATTGTIVALAWEGDRLVAEVLGEQVRIAPVSEDDYCTVDAPFQAQIRFEPGKPRRMHLRVEGERLDVLEEIEVVSISNDRLVEYTGAFTSAELQVTYNLVLEDGNLFLRHKTAPRESLKPGLRDMFWVDGITLFFTRDNAGRVSGFTLDSSRVRKIHFIR
jgi:hypothetical protein